MPIYEYEHDSGKCDTCSARFEVMQQMGANPLNRCPTCDQPCHRVLSAFAVSTSNRQLLSPKNLEAKGFTQYVKAGDGYYEKTAGKAGPDVIRRDGSSL